MTYQANIWRIIVLDYQLNKVSVLSKKAELENTFPKVGHDLFKYLSPPFGVRKLPHRIALHYIEDTR